MNNELYHYGIKGQKWGVRRFQNKDGSLTAKGKKRYLDQDGALTSAGKRSMNELNNRALRDDYNFHAYRQSYANVNRFSKGEDPVSKFLTKANKMNLSRIEKAVDRNDEKIKKLLADFRDQKVDVVLGLDPYSKRLIYKQSDEQQLAAQDAKLYRKEGIRITRDEDYRITNVKAENANKKTIKRVNRIATRGYY